MNGVVVFKLILYKGLEFKIIFIEDFMGFFKELNKLYRNSDNFLYELFVINIFLICKCLRKYFNCIKTYNLIFLRILIFN